ncbi:hypothetical protein ATANTOWER_010507 [Ataeniobius toweri]|uniref:Uncharacterized protein n=1 Tax=Ataeniobius toweri TaxID=208326 RepID=A0ABU7C5E9_9TELE|nr:hypothetical protein [Ataeniobius toweri]
MSKDILWAWKRCQPPISTYVSQEVKGSINISDFVEGKHVEAEGSMAEVEDKTFEGDSGGPLMCKQGNSWFQPVVLPLVKTSNTTKRANPMMVFEKLDRFQSFLTSTLGTFLSPASTNMTTSGVPISHPSFFLLGHLLLFALCLQAFT